LGVGAAATLAAACSSSTSPHVAMACPTYSGGAATPATLAGSYTLVSFCQDTVPALGPMQGVTGILTLTHLAGTTTHDSFLATITTPTPPPVVLAGPYAVSHDTITVNVPFPLGTFSGTYRFSANTLHVSSHLPGSPPPPIALVFFR
ncbi:MAG TPA: hypothetical protein VHQ03_11435, partial [Candidatus Dormibacteraeota bacterium]|nr:hypothetical protein [Candidatus Dormibacteraeota bacterium]